MVICKNCNAFMRFDPATQMVKCDHCGSAVMAGFLKDEKESGVAENEEYEAVIYTCPQCGGDMICDDDTMATFCSYCGASSVVLGKRLEKIAKPERIIPFKKTKEECEEIYRENVKKALFAPDYMKDNTVIEKFRGIYMPYWVYFIHHDGDLNMTGIHKRRQGDYILSDSYSISSHVKADCDGLAFDASASFYDEMSKAIVPYKMEDAAEFRQAYISGFYADMCNVPAHMYEDNAVRIAEQYIAGEIKKEPSLGTYEIDVSKAAGEGAAARVRAELDYFPVWFLAVKDKKGDVSYAVVNGQTGRIAMDMPIDYKKYILGSLALAVPIILLLNLVFTPKPTFLIWMGVVFAVLSGMCLNEQLDRIYTRYLGFDDEGAVYRSMKKEEGEGNRMDTLRMDKMRYDSMGKVKSTLMDAKPMNKVSVLAILFFFFRILPDVAGIARDHVKNLRFFGIAFFVVVALVIALVKHSESLKEDRPERMMFMPFSEKLKVLIRPILAVAVSLVVIIANPINDMYYYGGAILSMFLVLTSFYDLIKGHNRITKRKPPQFEKRGGDV